MRHKVRVEVHLNDGTLLQETVETARGSERNFATEAEIISKFRRLASNALPPLQIDALVDHVMSIEQLKEASELARLLTPGAPS
jgi:2-methylcitrate dehydratase PrpD